MARRTGAAADEDITRDTELMLDDDEGEPDASVFDAADLDGDEGEP